MIKPCDKTQYDSYKAAQAACAHIRSKIGMKVYKCKECGTFHIMTIKKSKATFKIKEKYKQDYKNVKPKYKKEIIIRPANIHDYVNLANSTYRPFKSLLK